MSSLTCFTHINYHEAPPLFFYQIISLFSFRLSSLISVFWWDYYFPMSRAAYLHTWTCFKKVHLWKVHVTTFINATSSTFLLFSNWPNTFSAQAHCALVAQRVHYVETEQSNDSILTKKLAEVMMHTELDDTAPLLLITTIERALAHY